MYFSPFIFTIYIFRQIWNAFGIYDVHVLELPESEQCHNVYESVKNINSLFRDYAVSG